MDTMTPLQRCILDWLVAHHDATFAELRQATGREALTLYRALRALAEAGRIQVDGPPQSRQRRYRPVPRAEGV
jgi:Fe2+ or Zn2+ uptake regulation protein